MGGKKKMSSYQGQVVRTAIDYFSRELRGFNAGLICRVSDTPIDLVQDHLDREVRLGRLAVTGKHDEHIGDYNFYSLVAEAVS